MNQLKDGKKHGYWEENDENCSIIKGNYIDWVPDGLAETFYPNGQLKCKFNALDGKVDRFFFAYFEDGKLWKEWNLKNGNFHGIYKTYFENGQLETSKIFKDNKAHGLETEFFEDGTLKAQTNWFEGNIVASEQYYDNGQLRFRISFYNVRIITPSEIKNMREKILPKFTESFIL